MATPPVLWIVVPCYNEEHVLPMTIPSFLGELKHLKTIKKIHESSKILFVNDGSSDLTKDIIWSVSKNEPDVLGLSLSRNKGHQNALLAGLMEAKDHCDISISIDCDGQDDISVMEQMVDEYQKGNDVVYGVRSSREKDTWFKKSTAQNYYKFLQKMGVDVVYNHADYRLTSAKVLRHLSDYKEVNLFLRGLFPEIGFTSSTVTYERETRLAGKSHYSIRKMMKLALDGMTSFTIKPIEYVLLLGGSLTFLGFFGILLSLILFAVIKSFYWLLFLLSFLFTFHGLELFCFGLIGEYIGKTYMESKHRPRYIVEEKTYEESLQKGIVV